MCGTRDRINDSPQPNLSGTKTDRPSLLFCFACLFPGTAARVQGALAAEPPPQVCRAPAAANGVASEHQGAPRAGSGLSPLILCSVSSLHELPPRPCSKWSRLPFPLFVPLQATANSSRY